MRRLGSGVAVVIAARLSIRDFMAKTPTSLASGLTEVALQLVAVSTSDQRLLPWSPVPARRLIVPGYCESGKATKPTVGLLKNAVASCPQPLQTLGVVQRVTLDRREFWKEFVSLAHIE